MIYYEYERLKNDLPLLGSQCESFHPDTIIAIARGGMTLAHALSMYLGVRNLQSLRCESYDNDIQRSEITVIGECDLAFSQRVLVVDDIVDSGKTLLELLPILQNNHPHVTFKSVALFTKPTALIQPDFSLHRAEDWIEFFWERDFLKEGSL